MNTPNNPEVRCSSTHAEYLVVMPDGSRYGVFFGDFLDMLDRSRKLEPLIGKRNA